MAAYPSYSILLDSKQELESGYLDDFAESGTHYSRAMHSSQYYQFEVKHRLTAAQWSSLSATYLAGARDAYTLTYRTDTSPIETYNVKFTAPPQIIDNLGANTYVVKVMLRGTKNG